MSERYGTERSVTIQAPIESVWEALTSPEIIKRWFFGVDTVTHWKVGSPIVHRGEYQGRAYEDKGTILEFDPPRRLVHTHWSPVSELPDTPENHERVAWELAEREDGTELTVRESNLASEEAKATSERNWEVVLAELKKLLEG